MAYEMNLNGEEAVALLQMTPFAWRAKPEVWDALAARTTFGCQTDFSIHVWQRDALRREVCPEDLGTNADQHDTA